MNIAQAQKIEYLCKNCEVRYIQALDDLDEEEKVDTLTIVNANNNKENILNNPRILVNLFASNIPSIKWMDKNGCIVNKPEKKTTICTFHFSWINCSTFYGLSSKSVQYVNELE